MTHALIYVCVWDKNNGETSQMSMHVELCRKVCAYLGLMLIGHATARFDPQ